MIVSFLHVQIISTNNARENQEKIDNDNTPNGLLLNTHTSHIQKSSKIDMPKVCVVSSSLQLPEKKISNNQRLLRTLINESEVYNTTDRLDTDVHRETINQSQRDRTSKHAVYLSEKQSSVCCGNFSCRHVLIFFTTSLVGCLAIAALILPNLLLYSILPTLCKLSIILENEL